MSVDTRVLGRRRRTHASALRLRSYAGRIATSPGLLAAWAVVVGVLLAAVAPRLFTDQDPLEGIGNPGLAAPSADHLFGTDSAGRDVFSRIVHGAGESVQAVVIAVIVGVLLGSILGLLSGYFGGWIDDITMRFVDVMLAVPTILIALMIIAALGQGTTNVAIAVGIANVSGFARVMRSQVLKIRSSDFIEATTFAGIGRPRILLTHLVPNASTPVFALATLELGQAILSVAALSFLGFGAAPPAPEWGAMVAAGRNYLATAWWLIAFPGIAIALTVVAANRIARSLRFVETGV